MLALRERGQPFNVTFDRAQQDASRSMHQAACSVAARHTQHGSAEYAASSTQRQACSMHLLHDSDGVPTVRCPLHDGSAARPSHGRQETGTRPRSATACTQPRPSVSSPPPPASAAAAPFAACCASSIAGDAQPPDAAAGGGVNVSAGAESFGAAAAAATAATRGAGAFSSAPAAPVRAIDTAPDGLSRGPCADHLPGSTVEAARGGAAAAAAAVEGEALVWLNAGMYAGHKWLRRWLALPHTPLQVHGTAYSRQHTMWRALGMPQMRLPAYACVRVCVRAYVRVGVHVGVRACICRSRSVRVAAG